MLTVFAAYIWFKMHKCFRTLILECLQAKDLELLQPNSKCSIFSPEVYTVKGAVEQRTSLKIYIQNSIVFSNLAHNLTEASSV